MPREIDTYERLKLAQERHDRRWAIITSIGIVALIGCAVLSAWIVAAGKLR